MVQKLVKTRIRGETKLNLTKEEIVVLNGLSAGQSNAEIANNLNYTERHISRIVKKLNRKFEAKNSKELCYKYGKNIDIIEKNTK